MSEKLPTFSRRDFLKAALLTVGILTVSQIPDWVDSLETEKFDELIQICKEVLSPEEVLDVLDQEDYQEALGLVYSFILNSGLDPDEYLISQDYIIPGL